MWTWFLALIIGISSYSWDANLDLPNPQPVVDEVGLLSAGEAAELDRVVREVLKNSSVELSIYIAKDLRGLAIEDFSIAVVEKWQLGKKKTDKGLLFLVAPKERKMRIEVGYGLEGDLTDAYSRRILDQRVRPHFRQGNYFLGLMSGLAGIQERVPLGVEIPEEKGIRLPFWLIFVLVVFVVLASHLRSFTRYGYVGRGTRGGWGGRSSSWGGSSGWGGGGGWSGGSSWGGGGGGFGGGGASSNW